MSESDRPWVSSYEEAIELLGMPPDTVPVDERHVFTQHVNYAVKAQGRNWARQNWKYVAQAWLPPALMHEPVQTYDEAMRVLGLSSLELDPDTPERRAEIVTLVNSSILAKGRHQTQHDRDRLLPDPDCPIPDIPEDFSQSPLTFERAYDLLGIQEIPDIAQTDPFYPHAKDIFLRGLEAYIVRHGEAWVRKHRHVMINEWQDALSVM